MYSWEIEEYIKIRNYLLNSKELSLVSDTQAHRQINWVIYYASNDSYEMTTTDGYHYCYKFKK